MKHCILLLMVCFLVTSPAYGKLATIGKGADVQIDSTGFPPQMKAHTELMKAKCSRCHDSERIVIAVTTGVAPISGQHFNAQLIKNTVSTMTRRANAVSRNTISKEEGKSIASLLDYLIKRAEL